MRLKVRLISIRNKLMCPFICALIQVSILYLAFIYLINFNFYYKAHQIQNNLPKIIKQSVSQCGIGHWLSWVSINQLEEKYSFIDIYSCKEEKKDCAISVKSERSFFNQEHNINANEIDILKSMKSGNVIFYPNIQKIKESNNHFKSTIYKAITEQESDIKKFGLVPIKKFKNNTIYLLTLSKTKSNKCSDEEMINILNKLANYVEDKI